MPETSRQTGGVPSLPRADYPRREPSECEDFWAMYNARKTKVADYRGAAKVTRAF